MANEAPRPRDAIQPLLDLVRYHEDRVARGYALLAIGLIDPSSSDVAYVLDDCGDVEQSARKGARRLDEEAARVLVAILLESPTGTSTADDNANLQASRAVWIEQIVRQFPCLIPDFMMALTSEKTLGDWLVTILGRVGEDHPEVVLLLGPLLDHESDSIRNAALEVWAMSGRMPVESLPRLAVALGGEDEVSGGLDVALVHMTQLHPREVVAALVDTLGGDGLIHLDGPDFLGQPTIKVLVEELTRLLDSPEGEIRRAAASRLAGMRANAIHAVPRLRELLDDNDLEVRDAARVAVAQIERHRDFPT